MKLVSLNTWTGKIFEPLIEFITVHKDADIFCFQEIFRTPIGKKGSHGAGCRAAGAALEVSSRIFAEKSSDFVQRLGARSNY
ncbi:MAG: hypothetical protein A3G60_01890 [Candidatus Ryanbacteria bacterium RIFCSPLOWO2_12_FULL_47_9c]|uniref:Endonuclease/exonuclease/phosphatase domain-containing protein n=1 Tax=Candidatus Ryanbacteria bacterium RIFCSPLOWO2_12_FULL_47_9c TaxID=1802131 RepID=A0A1G2H1Q6_9BACT|nr:MAG: hypothetical protein A3C83_02865 [Candidatus Ryanbacteria bacterium RIFCSPHIGHO2_02_FULL_47_25]OGZ56240.1 MAG: hypothetical protein A3G60_01890 [Candidatus Ryanbacteria bacterium RIFCSPLOWO2_12_FULL_47_9c]